MKQYAQTSILKEDQALIPQTYKKRLQSKALLEHYKDNNIRKINSQQEKIYQKLRQLQYGNLQTQRHYYEQEKKKLMKELNKYQYAKQYDQMIQMRKQREQEQKNREIWLQRRLLQDGTWIRNREQQKQAEQQKKLEYAKELEKILKEEQQRRANGALKLKQLREGVKKQYEQSQKKEQIQIQKYKSRSVMDRRQPQRYSVKDSLYWPIGQENQKRQQKDQDGRPITPRMDLMIKNQKKYFYGKGVQAQYKSQNQRKYFQRSNPEINKSQTNQPLPYNPITNPIPYKYKNPVVLKILNNYN